MQQGKIIQARNFVLSFFLKKQNEDKNFSDKNKKNSAL